MYNNAQYHGPTINIDLNSKPSFWDGIEMKIGYYLVACNPNIYSRYIT